MDSMGTGQVNRDQMRELQRMVDRLEIQVQNLERQVQQQSSYIDRRIRDLPDSDLLSPKFLTRAFAVLGHQIVASLLLSLIFYCIFGLFAGFFAALLGLR